MKAKIVPYDAPAFRVDVIGKEDEGKTLAFRSQVHEECSKRFNHYFNWLLCECNKTELKELKKQKQKMYLDFFFKVNEHLYRIIDTATEDINDDYKRGKKRIELQKRIDVHKLVSEVPLPVTDLVKRIAKKRKYLPNRIYLQKHFQYYHKLCLTFSQPVSAEKTFKKFNLQRSIDAFIRQARKET